MAGQGTSLSARRSTPRRGWQGRGRETLRPFRIRARLVRQTGHAPSEAVTSILRRRAGIRASGRSEFRAANASTGSNPALPAAGRKPPAREARIRPSGVPCYLAGRGGYSAHAEKRAISAHIFMRWPTCSLMVLRQTVLREVEQRGVVVGRPGDAPNAY
jgi:hypothetical protein